MTLLPAIATTIGHLSAARLCAGLTRDLVAEARLAPIVRPITVEGSTSITLIGIAARPLCVKTLALAPGSTTEALRLHTVPSVKAKLLATVEGLLSWEETGVNLCKDGLYAAERHGSGDDE